MSNQFFLNKFSTNAWWGKTSMVVSLGCVGLLGYAIPRADFWALVFLFALAFAAYFLQLQSALSLRQGMMWAMGMRVVLLFAWPALSDDYFRFIWDGHLLQNGLNPYLSLPSDWLAPPTTLPVGLTPHLYQNLNSPHYYSVYPPMCQAVFWLSTWGTSSLLANVVVMRFCLLLAEIGTLLLLPKLLRQLGLPPRQALWYALNPAIIVELTGNLHFEAFMVFFLVAAMFFFTKNRWRPAALLLGLAAGSKFLPLMLLPLLPRYLGWRRAFWVGIIMAGALGVLFLPFLSPALWGHLGNSLQLYFQRFEFNASFYYLLRALGQWSVGFNLIAFTGPGLSVLTFIGIWWLGLCFRSGKNDNNWFLLACLAAFTVYFAFATVVHPWYLSTLVVLACGTRFRFAMVWSAMAVLSYAAYRHPSYQENLWLVALEYTVVFGYFFWEIKRLTATTTFAPAPKT